MRALEGRRSPLIAAGLASALLFTACGEEPRPGTPPEHVLLVTVEALRADHCSSFGYPRRTTFVQRLTDERALDPDRVAETGVLFANAFAPAPEARASLGALMRSRAPGSPGGEASLARGFADAGFACAAVLVPSESLADEARALGFEHVLEFGAGPGEPEPERAAFEAARAWVAERVAAGERYLLWIHLGRPAPPFESPPLADEYSAPEGDERERAIDAYDGELARTTALLCELFESLQTMDGAPLSRSVVALCGLSGLALPPGDEGARLDEAHLHVPLALRHPASLTGRRILTEQVVLTDLAPTLLDWFGLDGAEEMTGRSLLPVLDSYVERPFDRRGALAVDGGRASLRVGRWRLVLAADGAALYDVVRDPEQRLELGAREPEVRDALAEELRQRLASEGGP